MGIDRDTWRHCPACDGCVPSDRSHCPACGREIEVHPPVAGSANGSEQPEAEPSAARMGLPPMRLARGTRVSVYRIESVLGEGGMGVVYRAWDEAVGRPVAIKCLHTNLAGDPDIRRRFAREARVLRADPHPRVIQVDDFIEFDYLLGIVMEL
ncbi:MAG TPA: hypothetical protein VG963_05785, partial [Polyangiaceae bacterium]|nr:hypothetical protein [Polyangiaceae bacterium]